MQQQHEKTRKKRDYNSDIKLGGYNPYVFLRPSARTPYAPPALRVQGLRQLVDQPLRLQYRDASPHNIFPDPLYKEQWYLVSKVCVHRRFRKTRNLQIELQLV